MKTEYKITTFLLAILLFATSLQAQAANSDKSSDPE